MRFIKPPKVLESGGGGGIVETTWTNTVNANISPTYPRQLPQEVIGKEHVILSYSTSPSSNCKMYLLRRTDCLSKGFINPNFTYDPATGIWSTSGDSIGIGDLNIRYKIIAF